MRVVNKIIIHHSDSDFGDVAIIDQWHKERGFRSPSGVHCGYHRIILNGVRVHGRSYRAEEDGMVENGRLLTEWGAHTHGHNSDSIGICVIGKEVFTPKQFATLDALIREFKTQFSITEVAGHNHYEATSCPMFDWKKWLKERGL